MSSFRPQDGTYSSSSSSEEVCLKIWPSSSRMRRSQAISAADGLIASKRSSSATAVVLSGAPDFGDCTSPGTRF
jgi:hypothetical protein